MSARFGFPDVSPRLGIESWLGLNASEALQKTASDIGVNAERISYVIEFGVDARRPSAAERIPVDCITPRVRKSAGQSYSSLSKTEHGFVFSRDIRVAAGDDKGRGRASRHVRNNSN
jgi:hypothetical protein